MRAVNKPNYLATHSKKNSLGFEFIKNWAKFEPEFKHDKIIESSSVIKVPDSICLANMFGSYIIDQVREATVEPLIELVIEL